MEDGLVALPGIGAMEDVARNQTQVTVLPDAYVRNLPGKRQHGIPELLLLFGCKIPQRGIQLPVRGV